ncbi:hypothetical protein D3C72_1290760 [compost metagenome]
MHRRDLPVADMHDFLRVAFFVRYAVRRAVAQGEKGESLCGKMVPAEGGDVPAEFEIEDFAPGVAIELPPLGRRETGKRRQVYVMHRKELPRMAEDFVDFGAFHGNSFSGALR